MDSSEDLVTATFEYLLDGVIRGATGLRPEQALELIERSIGLACRQFYSMTVPRIDAQVPIASSRIPEAYRGVPALKVYAIGDEAWSATDITECWFVDRRGQWYWLRVDANGNEVAECCEVDSEHLVLHFVKDESADELVPLGVHREVDRKLVEFLRRAATRQRRSADENEAAARKIEQPNGGHVRIVGRASTTPTTT